ncbi:MAG: M18 family aminopeptidase [Clostridium sp.]|nr:M18 family aminopeptidase [Clostridium sp.]
MEAFKEVIQQGITAFHVVEHGKKRLKQAGYQELEYGTDWSHLKAGDYYTVPYPSMLIAFHIGADEQQEGVRIAMAHTDSPCFKVKANPNMPGKYYVRANVEPYGGLLKTTWFDRPLGVAGKVILRGKDAFHPESRLVRSEAAVAVIPSLAPHLARGSEKSEIDVQQELIPIIGLGETEDLLRDILWRPNGIEEAHILDYDLYLYNMDQPEEIGANRELISAPRIDNLASVAALLSAMEQLAKNADAGIAVAAMFDNEEIGSRSKQGADSVLLVQILNKLGAGLGYESLAWQDRLSRGFLLSMDGAQGHHPNYPDKSDPTNQVYPGQGIVIKTSASQRYLSDSEASAVVKELCGQAEIAWQQQVNRSGMPGGQTLGPIASSYLPILGADIGIPMLAMHSSRELAAVADYKRLEQFAYTYYSYENKEA